MEAKWWGGIIREERVAPPKPLQLLPFDFLVLFRLP